MIAGMEAVLHGSAESLMVVIKGSEVNRVS
jgi:hypothetical protein